MTDDMELEEGGRGGRSFVVWLLSLLVLLSSGTAFYFYQKSLAPNPAAAAQASQAEVKALVAQVGRLILLPTGEDPTVATVVDPSLLKDQAFFTNASKGDKVLIYYAAKRAVLYSPSQNKVINVAPVDINASAASAPATPSTQSNTTSNTTKN